MLDTKLKSNKYIINIVVAIVILIASVGMCLVYPRIEKESDKFGYNVFEEEYRFLRDINKINHTLYFKINEGDEVNNNKQSPSDILLDLDNVVMNKKIEEDSYYQDEYSRYIENFDNEIHDTYKNLSSSFENLHYYAVNENNLVMENKNGEIEELILKEKSSNIINQLKEDYRFYMVVNFDKKGNMKISNVHGANKEKISTYMEAEERNYSLDDGYTPSGVKLDSIRSMKFVYAVPKNIVPYDKVSNYILSEENYSISTASTLYINIAVAFILLVGLLIPYNEIKEVTWLKKIFKIPFEILIILVIAGFIFAYGSSELVISRTIKNELINFTQLQLGKDAINILTYLINIVYWSLCFSLIFIGITTIKHIIKNGMKNYFKEDTIIYKIGRYITGKIKCVYKWSTNIELSKKDNKKLITILGINLIVLILMCSMWFFGIILAVIYTIALSIMLRKHYTKTKEDYSKLLNITNEISKGNLDVNIDEDLGSFNVLKSEIENIQKGFKKAVDEEVKSQKMKTELISNVSHDLKTPLTSIITYVDLLKDESLSEEKRRLYLDTLDRKSQRLQELIEDLFEVSKANSGNISLNKVDVDVVSLMKQTLLELDDKIKVSSLVVRKNFPDEKVILSLDSQRMFRVFENLIINITKYAMEGSRVYIDILDNEDYIEISLKNMTKDEISFNVNDLVERFVRGDKSRNTDGSGLGLAIAKSFVELQGGDFNVSIDGDLFKVVIKFMK